MGLPGKLGASLAADMSKNGLTSAAPAALEDDAASPDEGDGGGIETILADIDEKVPGLGSLIHELVDRLKAEDEEQDAEEG
jgi:hypothetical protein